LGGGGTKVVLPGKRGGGGVGDLDGIPATDGAGLVISDEVTLIFGSSTGAFEQPNTVQPPFSA
jgi:hypothetical protein